MILKSALRLHDKPFGLQLDKLGLYVASCFGLIIMSYVRARSYPVEFGCVVNL